MRFAVTRSAIERVAEKRIREAMEEGLFEDLPGLGKPIAGIDDPYDPLWWVKGWLGRLEREHGVRLRSRATKGAAT